ncbi:hypothetical protein QE152_g24721 [Popillia japonica]|uniref:Uncharacterized protein n=1 Tax=Popillia japonica TaxID=7064 RepID=A0AAW1K2I6_POPJA
MNSTKPNTNILKKQVFKSDNTTKGWITPELQQKCRQKRILYEDALNNKIDYHVYQNYAKTLQTEILTITFTRTTPKHFKPKYVMQENAFIRPL